MDAEFFPECGEAEGGLFDEVVRGDALFFCGLLDFLAVLVDACEEEYLIAAEAVVACDDIGEDLLIGVADVGSAVGVIDGGGEVEHGRTGGNQAAGAEARQGMGARAGGFFGKNGGVVTKPSHSVTSGGGFVTLRGAGWRVRSVCGERFSWFYK